MRKNSLRTVSCVDARAVVDHDRGRRGGAFDGVIKATISNPMKSDNWIIYQ